MADPLILLNAFNKYRGL